MLRWRDQTTRPRLRITDTAKKPRMAPTMMKTVPSGRLDCCINGASAVGGTGGATITKPPLSVGKLVGPVTDWEFEGDLEADESILDALDVWSEDWEAVLEAVVCDEDDGGIVCAFVLDCVELPVSVVADEGRLGRSVDDLPAAETAKASRPTPAARETRRDRCENLMA
jgi:hypothetical protein